MACGLPFLPTSPQPSAPDGSRTPEEESMLRSLAFASALVVASLSASALSAQTSATPSKPTPSATSHAPSVHANVDSGRTSTMSKSAAKSTWTTEQIKEAQEGLAKAGFYKGKPTG